MKIRLSLDPRTRLLVVLLSLLITFFASNAAVVAFMLLMLLYLAVQELLGRAVSLVAIFAGLFALYVFVLKTMSAPMVPLIGFMLFYLMRLMPVVMAAVALGAASPGELIAALQTLRLPKSIIISLAVILRYMPGIAAQYRAVQDAARLRGVSMNVFGFFRHPILTLECALVPLLMSSLKISDELAASAAARGIEYPGPRSSLRQLRIRFADMLVVVLMTLAVVVFLVFLK